MFHIDIVVVKKKEAKRDTQRQSVRMREKEKDNERKCVYVWERKKKYLT